MPYKSTKDLPESIKSVLPDHAQDIYKEAFNSAYDEYKDPSSRRNDVDREEIAHRIAWSVVKKAGYEKSSDSIWHKST